MNTISSTVTKLRIRKGTTAASAAYETKQWIRWMLANN
jgi:hypothetical protein